MSYEHNSTDRKPGERGFTLIELVIASTLFVAAVGAAVLFSISTVKRQSEFMETGRMDSRRSALSALLRSDLNLAGRGLTNAKPQGAGLEIPIFSGTGFIQTTGGTITSTTTSVTTTATRGLGVGYGSFTAGIPTAQGSVQLALKDKSGLHLFAFYVTPTRWTAQDNTELISSDTVGLAPQAGDGYRISIDQCDQVQCVNFYVIRNQSPTRVYSLTQSQLDFPLQPQLWFAQSGASFTGMALNGVPIVDLAQAPTLVAAMPLFVDQALPLPGPIAIDASHESMTILYGDPDTDPAIVTGHDVETERSYTPTKPITVTKPRRGSFAPGDIVLLIDFDASVSALFELTSAEALTNSLINLEGNGLARGAGSSTAWGLISPDESYLNHTYPQGTVLVKLAPPVQWHFDGTTLLRKQGTEPWQIAELGISYFRIDELISNGRRTYQANLTLNAENIDLGQAEAPAQSFEVTLTPRALNLTYNPQT